MTQGSCAVALIPSNSVDDQYGVVAAVPANVVVSMAGETLLIGGTSSTSVDSSLMLGVRQVWPLSPRPLQVVCAVVKSVVVVVAAVAQMSPVSTSCTSPAAT